MEIWFDLIHKPRIPTKPIPMDPNFKIINKTILQTALLKLSPKIRIRLNKKIATNTSSKLSAKQHIKHSRVKQRSYIK